MKFTKFKIMLFYSIRLLRHPPYIQTLFSADSLEHSQLMLLSLETPNFDHVQNSRQNYTSVKIYFNLQARTDLYLSTLLTYVTTFSLQLNL